MIVLWWFICKVSLTFAAGEGVKGGAHRAAAYPAATGVLVCATGHTILKVPGTRDAVSLIVSITH